MSLQFRNPKLERTFSSQLSAELGNYDKLAWSVEIVWTALQWSRVASKAEDSRVYLALAVMTGLNVASLCLLAVRPKLYATWWREPSFLVHKSLLVIHLLATGRSAVFNLSKSPAGRLWEGWAILCYMCYTAVMFRQKLRHHLYVQLATATVLVCNQPLLLEMVAANQAHRATQAEQRTSIGSRLCNLLAYLSSSASLNLTNNEHVIQVWGTALVVAVFVLPTCVIYWLELAGRRGFLKRIGVFDIDQELEHRCLMQVLPLRLLAIAAVVVLWYVPELCLSVI